MSKLIEIVAAMTAFVFTGAALDAAIKVAVLLALAVVVTRALRGSSAAIRHSIWSAAIAAALVVPVLAIALPSWHLAIPGADAARSLAGRVSRAVEAPTPEAPRDVQLSASGPGVAPRTSAGRVAPSEGSDETTLPGTATGAAAPTSGPGRVATEETPTRLPLVLFSVWLLGAVIALAPLFLGALQLRAIARRSHDVESDALDDFAAQLARSLGVRRVVRVVQGEGAATPMTWGVLHPVVLVPEGFESWPESRQRDVLLHELAHVARYDCLTQHVARVVCALHWYNPLAWIAARRLRIERERACDDRVLLAGARASEYAEHILSIARTLRAPGIAGAAALAMARPSHLEGRLLALLDGRRRRAVLTRSRALGIGTAALVVAAALATISPWAVGRAEATEADAANAATDPNRAIDRSAIVNARPDTDTTRAAATLARRDSLRVDSARNGMRTEVVDGRRVSYGPGSEIVMNVGPKSQSPSQFRLPGCTLASHRSSSATVSDNDSHMKASVKNDDCELTLEREGPIEFNATFTDITAVEADGWVMVYDKGGSTTHKLRIENDGGTLVRTWYVNGAKQPYDADASRWLADALNTLDRYTQFSHGARLAVVYKQRGANGVLDEVASSGSDYEMRSEVERLLRMTKLDQQQIERVLGFAATGMSSDYEKSQLLQALLKQGLVTPALQGKYIAAAGTISSDYERRQALTAIVDAGGLGVESQNAVLAAARRISSDYDMREMLTEVVKKYGLSKATAPAFLAGASRISSDYDMRTLLTSVMSEQDNLDSSIVDSFLDLGAKEISSDYDKAEFFITVARALPNTEASRERVAKAAESIQSESDYGRVLSSLRKLKNSSGGR